LLGKLIPAAQILIVLLTVFTIWASAQKGRIERKDKLALNQKVIQTELIAENLLHKNSILEKDINDSKVHINELKENLAPRSISQNQETALLRNLSFEPGCQIGVASRILDHESFNYAEQIANIFRKAKWKVAPIIKNYLDDTENDVAMLVTDTKQKETALKLLNILNGVGIKTNSEIIKENKMTDIQPNTIYLIVGSKK
jgi:hypothetical protein